MSIPIEAALKPLFASLKRLHIGEYLHTKDFELHALEEGLDDLWKVCMKEVYSKKKFIALGFGVEIEDHEEGLMYAMSVWYTKRPDTFHHLILPILTRFAEWTPTKVDYTSVLLRLEALQVESKALDQFAQSYAMIQEGKPGEFKQERPELKKSEVDSKTNTEATLQVAPVNTKIKRVFISHASKDVKYVEELIDLLKLIGLQKNQIFCTSVPGYGIPLGANFLSEIKDQISNEVLVLFVFTSNFYASHVCLAELGAAWVLSKEHVPIVVPPFGFGDIKGVLPNTQGMIINDELQVNELARKIESLFGLASHSVNDDWERSRKRIIERINHSIAQDAVARAFSEGSAKPHE
ncbi:toll/interleukin-1 receptor domain-containing protein [Hymenobacter arizonensis]|uniref:TIR domain-containing protein n=1 Tax=Hymenobacter arizonensis TaxID=1227077 RepID=A0A1I5T757_HYMAR|nr:toll/interleukin-1 receptor domain-containing protein [Hymenobacter arizonensis]SFP78869.1 TIR domain-containing protein [Hymenobacter arizonensis]